MQEVEAYQQVVARAQYPEELETLGSHGGIWVPASRPLQLVLVSEHEYALVHYREAMDFVNESCALQTFVKGTIPMQIVLVSEAHSLSSCDAWSHPRIEMEIESS